MLMSQNGFLATSIILFLIGFIGFFANLIVIVLMARNRKLWTPLNCILLNLIISDFSVSIFGNPFTLFASIANEWIFGHSMCVAYGFFMALLGITSITTLTVLALERYFMISRPLNRSMSRKNAFTLVGFAWMYSFILTFPPLIGWGEYGLEGAHISCSINWETKNHSSTSYIMFLFVFGFFVPVFVILYSYTSIILTIRKNRLEMGTVSKAESRVACMIALMITAFFVAWTPYAIFSLAKAFFNVNISPAIATIPAIFAKSSICYNPIIYAGLNTQFKEAWCRLLGIKVQNEVSIDCATTAFSSVSPRKNVHIVKNCEETSC